MRHAVAAVLRKDLRLELRAPQAVPAMALFSVTTLVVFHFALQRNSVEGELAAGVLAVTLLFAAMLGIVAPVRGRARGGRPRRLPARPRRPHGAARRQGHGAVLLPRRRSSSSLVPAFVLLLLGPTLDAGGFAQLALLLVLADAGIAVIGTLVGAIAVQTRARDLLVPLLALPLLIPVVIGLARGATPLFLEAGAGSLPGRWLAGPRRSMIWSSALLAYALFDYLVED